jgi:hypothetical protein
MPCYHDADGDRSTVDSGLAANLGSNQSANYLHCARNRHCPMHLIEIEAIRARDDRAGRAGGSSSSRSGHGWRPPLLAPEDPATLSSSAVGCYPMVLAAGSRRALAGREYARRIMARTPSMASVWSAVCRVCVATGAASAAGTMAFRPRRARDPSLPRDHAAAGAHATRPFGRAGCTVVRATCVRPGAVRLDASRCRTDADLIPTGPPPVARHRPPRGPRGAALTTAIAASAAPASSGGEA